MKVLKEDWSREVSDCINSGKSYMRYAREREINYNQLLYWIKKLEINESKFVELKPAKESTAVAKSPVDRLELELSLPGGVVLRMRGA